MRNPPRPRYREGSSWHRFSGDGKMGPEDLICENHSWRGCCMVYRRFGLNVKSGFPQQTAQQVGLTALLTAMIYLAVVVLPNERNRRLFFEGPDPEEEQTLHIGCLWFGPASAFLWAVIIWMGRLLF